MAGIDAILTENSDGIWDIGLTTDGDIASENAFDTYIKVALFTDIRADSTEVSVPERRRGWIGNEATPGFQMGSKLWLLSQSPLNQDIANKAEEYARQALQKMVDEKLAISVRVVATIVADGMVLKIIIFRPDSAISLRFFNLWQLTALKEDLVTPGSGLNPNDPPILDNPNYNSLRMQKDDDFETSFITVGMTTKWTIAVWFKKSFTLTSGEHTRMIFELRTTVGNGNRNKISLHENWQSGAGNDRTVITVWNDAQNDNKLWDCLGASHADIPLIVGKWNHFVFTFDGSLAAVDQFHFYINGVEPVSPVKTTDDALVMTDTPARAIKIMTAQTSDGEGQSHNYAIWNRTLSSAQVVEIYNSGSSFKYDEVGDEFYTQVEVDSMIHYWQFGFDGLANMGLNYGSKTDLLIQTAEADGPFNAGDLILGDYPDGT